MRVRAINRLLPALVVTGAAAALLAAPSAEAAFGPIQLISKSSREQASAAAEPAISADGRYVAFRAEFGGEEGVFREQLETDQLIAVAVGPHSFITPNGSAPSISADGRYVSFDTDQVLTATDTDEAEDVYVADLDTSPPTYRLVSAVDGSKEPLPGGSTAVGGTAISADGNRVAFGSEGNVYVRELSTERTILISARREPDGAMSTEPVVGGGAYEPAGAAISADGSTVAWVGEHLPEQVPLLGDEEAAIKAIEAGSGEGVENSNEYHEPLWRRVPGSGEEAPPTRRIVGGGDPLAPGCPPMGTLEEVACQGPYPDAASNHPPVQIFKRNGFGWGVKLPKLDADGDEVALAGDPDEDYDLFVIDMEGGLDRREAVRQVTRWTNPVPGTPSTGGKFDWEVIEGGNGGQYLPFAGEITDCAISPDGNRVAFTTTRQHFSTTPFALITQMPSAVSLLPELYELNLEADTIERATPGAGQNVSESVKVPQRVMEGANPPSFGKEGRLIAFASEADNLVADDANEASDVFTIESPPPTPVGQSTIAPPPPRTAVPSGWRMTANAYSRPDGEVRVVARVPASGTLRATARAQVGSRLKSHRMATSRRRSKMASVVDLELKLGPQRRTLAIKPGLVTRIGLTFESAGGSPLHVDLQGRFLVHHKRPAKLRKAAGK
jgi:hypothetical protein